MTEVWTGCSGASTRRRLRIPDSQMTRRSVSVNRSAEHASAFQTRSQATTKTVRTPIQRVTPEETRSLIAQVVRRARATVDRSETSGRRTMDHGLGCDVQRTGSAAGERGADMQIARRSDGRRNAREKVPRLPGAARACEYQDLRAPAPRYPADSGS